MGRNFPSRRRVVLCTVVASSLSALGCKSSYQKPAVAADHLEVNVGLPEALRSSVKVLSQDIGERNCYRPENLRKASSWIESQLIADGYKVRSEPFDIAGKPFQCADQTVHNVIADLPGTQHPDQIVIVGAHYDSRVAMEAWHDHTTQVPAQRGTPGANDNGSGVAAVLAIAQAFARQPQPRTIRFCFWVNEEPPFYQHTDKDLMGSYVSASRSRSAGEDIRAAVVFDTVGCYSPQPNRKRSGVLDFAASTVGLPPTSDYVAFLGLTSNEKIVAASAKVFAAHSRVPVRTVVLPYIGPWVAWSDDWSYSKLNYPAYCVTDTAYLRSDRYHETADTIEGIDFGPFADVVWGVRYVIQDLATAERPING